MASDIKHSLAMLGSKPHLIALELAVIKTMYANNRVIGAHYILESETPMLVVTPELEAAIEAVLEMAQAWVNDADYMGGITGEPELGIVRNALAGLKGDE